jgi:hypothetical protein
MTPVDAIVVGRIPLYDIAIARSSLGLGLELCGEDGEPPDAIVPPPERIARPTRSDDGRTLALNVDARRSGQVPLEARGPPTAYRQEREYVGPVGRLGLLMPRGEQALALTGRVAHAHAITGFCAHVADGECRPLRVRLEIGERIAWAALGNA